MDLFFGLIPFIAGQWSLPTRRKAGGKGEKKLNPLHCGAVVASARRRVAEGDSSYGLIPFIAGQWSLPTSLGIKFRLG